MRGGAASLTSIAQASFVSGHCGQNKGPSLHCPLTFRT
jgi:hypothetical protein